MSLRLPAHREWVDWYNSAGLLLLRVRTAVGSRGPLRGSARVKVGAGCLNDSFFG